MKVLQGVVRYNYKITVVSMLFYIYMDYNDNNATYVSLYLNIKSKFVDLQTCAKSEKLARWVVDWANLLIKASQSAWPRTATIILASISLKYVYGWTSRNNWNQSMWYTLLFQYISIQGRERAEVGILEISEIIFIRNDK